MKCRPWVPLSCRPDVLAQENVGHCPLHSFEASRFLSYKDTRLADLCLYAPHCQRSRFKIHMKLSLQPLPHLPANSCKASPCRTHTAWQCRGGVCWQPFWKLLQHLDIKNGLERLLNMVQQQRCGNGGAWAIGI